MRLKTTYPIIFFMVIGLFEVSFCSSYEKDPRVVQTENKNKKFLSESNQTDPNKQTDWNHPRSDERLRDRERMIQTLRNSYGFDNEQVITAMLNVPRHWFVPADIQTLAYEDMPLPIGHGQTISQPFIVAYMTSLLGLTPQMKVLEIGTGSGYQAAVLSEFTPYIYTIEILEPLAQKAQEQFSNCGYRTIKVKLGDGYKGWLEYAPFDAIIVTCAPDHIPQSLIDQLKPGGRIVIPVGQADHIQDLQLVTKKADGSLEKKSMMPVRFVPLLRGKDEPSLLKPVPGEKLNVQPINLVSPWGKTLKIFFGVIVLGLSLAIAGILFLNKQLKN
jgi:protein-L-isoaspartate(D-aspartate) O-methyltransferase